ncbi:hypothetical protein FRB90_011573 [Tulasnella sp. 427]|nr:hypothetical protein FRB90_011573 [Tulasnella sp. 427]
MPRFPPKLAKLLERSSQPLNAEPKTFGIVDEKADAQDGEQDPTEAALKERQRTKQSARARLDKLPNLRISSTSLNFTSMKSHASGGKADVLQASFTQTVRLWRRSDTIPVAVKKIRSSKCSDKKKLTNEFVHEVEMTAGLAHENVVRLIGFVEDLENDIAWMVLPWESNGNLSEFLAKGIFVILERVSLIKDTLEGVKYLHTRRPPICHGDLKSMNILINSSYRAIITDFGSARTLRGQKDDVAEDGQDGDGLERTIPDDQGPPIQVVTSGSQLTLTGPAFSLRWAPPEVVNGRRPHLSSDIWAVGWAMTNQIPFQDVSAAGLLTLKVMRGEVPATREDDQLSQIIALCSLMKDCWAFNPAARPDIARCCSEIQWIHSAVPSTGMSLELLLEKACMEYARHKYQNAIALFQRTLVNSRWPDHAKLRARALNGVGDVYRAQSRFRLADEFYTKAHAAYGLINDAEGQASTLQRLGHVDFAQCLYDPAKDFYTMAKDAYIRIGSDFGIARAQLGIGDVYLARSFYNRAQDSFTQSQEISTRIANDQGRAGALLRLGHVYLGQHALTSAQEAYCQAQDIYVRIGDDLGQAEALLGMGHLFRTSSNFSQAKSSYIQAQEMFSRIGNRKGQADTLQGLGYLYLAESHNDQARDALARAKDTYHLIGYDKGSGETLLALGKTERARSEYARARECYAQAEAIFARIRLAGLIRADTLLGLGDMHVALSDHSKAITSYKSAEEIYSLETEGTQGKANARFGIGNAYFGMGRYEDAVKAYARGRELYTGSDNDQGQANSLVGLGDVYLARRNYDLAASLYFQAEGMYMRINDKTGEASTMLRLGHIYCVRPQSSRAESSDNSAQKFFDSMANHQNQANTFEGLTDQYSEAGERFLKAYRIYSQRGNERGRVKALMGIGDVLLGQSGQSEDSDPEFALGLMDVLPELESLQTPRIKAELAERCYTLAREISIRIGNVQGEATSLLKLAKACRVQSKTPEGEDFCAQAHWSFTRIGDMRGCEETLDELEAIYLVHVKGSVVKAEGSHSSNDQSKAQALRNLARVYVLQSKCCHPEQLASRSVSSDDRHGQGTVLSARTKLDRAEELYTEVIKIFTSTNNDQGLADALIGLVHVNWLQSKFTEARDAQLRAEVLWLHLNEESRASLLLERGLLYDAQSELSRAEEMYRRVLDIYRTLATRSGERTGSQWLQEFLAPKLRGTEKQWIWPSESDGEDEADGLRAFVVKRSAHRGQSKQNNETEKAHLPTPPALPNPSHQLALANTLHVMGCLYQKQSRNSEAAASFTEARQVFQRIGKFGKADVMTRLLSDVTERESSTSVW